MTAVRPVLIRQFAVALVLVLAATLVSATPADAIDRRRPAEIRNRIEYLINRQRVRYGLPRLRVNDKVQYWAKDHAKDMARKRTIYHDPNFTAESPKGCYAWAENVGRTSATDSARSAMSAFMNSSAHRSNILNRQMTHMGIGIAKAGNYTYIVQRFVDRR